MKINVLFVCNGNIFRSFSAESLLKQYLKEHKIKGWKVFSAGTEARKQNVDPEVIKKLKSFGIKNTHHKQHKLNASLLKKYNLIIAMAKDQISFMENNFNYKDASLFNEIANNTKISIWDIGDEVKDYLTNRDGMINKIDRTVQYIYDNIPNLVEGIIKTQDMQTVL